MTSSAKIEPPKRRRPRDRRASILRAAGAAFAESGYHGTSMADIAAAVGISATALYRHFRNKQELLGQCLLTGLDTTLARLAEAARAEEPQTRVLTELVAVALELRGLPRLWQLEFRSVSPEDRQAVLVRVVRLTGYLRRAVRVHRPDLSAPEVELLSWCVLSVAVSPSYHQVDLPATTFVDVLDGAVLALITADLSPEVPHARPATRAPQPGGTADFERTVRPERMIAAAARLFNTRGYAAVGIEDIGAAVGVSGPALYHHFASKSDLLNEIIERNDQWIRLYTSRALADGRDAGESMRLLLRYYVRFALDEPDLLGTTVSEVGHLPAPQARRYRRTHREGVLGWARMLQSARSELSLPVARVLIQAISTVVIDAVRNPRSVRRGDLLDALAAVGDRIAFSVPLSEAAAPTAP
ncbi:TetR/AcrR family transcriptional regulator [Nocardia xishanensis]